MNAHSEGFAVLQLGGELSEDGQRSETLVGDDERALHARDGEVLGDQVAGAGPKVDDRREGEFR